MKICGYFFFFFFFFFFGGGGGGEGVITKSDYYFICLFIFFRGGGEVISIHFRAFKGQDTEWEYFLGRKISNILPDIPDFFIY